MDSKNRKECAPDNVVTSLRLSASSVSRPSLSPGLYKLRSGGAQFVLRAGLRMGGSWRGAPVHACRCQGRRVDDISLRRTREEPAFESVHPQQISPRSPVFRHEGARRTQRFSSKERTLRTNWTSCRRITWRRSRTAAARGSYARTNRADHGCAAPCAGPSEEAIASGLTLSNLFFLIFSTISMSR
jgi:hypothetical protein